jgi:hypothetical protein
LNLIWAATTGQWSAAMQAMQYPIASAMTAGMRQVVDVVKVEGRARIAAAGFGKKWQNALQTKVYPKVGVSMDPAGWIYHKIPYAGVFEDGAKIAGSPYLWIPLSGVPAKIGAKRMTPANFIALIGPLQIVRPPGRAPLLVGFMQAASNSIGKVTIGKLRSGSALGRLGVRSRRSATGGGGIVTVPIFVGVTAVNLHARFNLRPVFRAAGDGLAGAYLRNLRV